MWFHKLLTFSHMNWVFFNSIEFLCLDKVNWIETKTQFISENVKNLPNHVVGRRFHNETKPQETFHCAKVEMIIYLETIGWQRKQQKSWIHCQKWTWWQSLRCGLWMNFLPAFCSSGKWRSCWWKSWSQTCQKRGMWSRVAITGSFSRPKWGWNKAEMGLTGPIGRLMWSWHRLWCKL